ncbi:MAG: xanthine phosphoribosyltransferase [Fusobacteriaceae bacterium]
MKLLKDLIKTKGKVVNGSMLKVDNFLNHQIDANLMYEVGKEFKERFKNLEGITKIVTIEASGIAIATAVAYHFGVPLVFAKKTKPATMGEFYTAKVHSFTKKKEYDICISREYIKAEDKVLIVDDFLAMGAAVLGLENIVRQAKGEVLGVGIVIEKGFQEGSKILREKGLNVQSLAILSGFENGKVIFKEE